MGRQEISAHQELIRVRKLEYRITDFMNKDQFWKIIDDARKPGMDCDEVVSGVRQQLERLSNDELLAFENELWRRMAESYRWDLWAVAYIVNGGCSDDGFDYFRAWLISQGRKYFEDALADPIRAADLAEPDMNECEDMLGVAVSIYRERTGSYPTTEITVHPSGPAGERWKEEDLENLYPELCERFS